MPAGDFSSVRKQMIQDFSKRQKEYHNRQQQFDLEKTTAAGGIEKDTNLALQNLRNRGALQTQEAQDKAAGERLASVQAFESPLQKAQIGNINQEAKGKAFDLRLGMDYSGSFLERARDEKNLLTEALRQQLGRTTASQKLLSDTSKPLESLQGKSMPFNFMDYHPWVLGYKGAKKVDKTLSGIPDFLSKHFRKPTIDEE